MIDTRVIRARAGKAAKKLHVYGHVLRTQHGYIPYVAQATQPDTPDGSIQAWLDADFQAHSYEDVPSLCDEVDRLQGALGEAIARMADEAHKRGELQGRALGLLARIGDGAISRIGVDDIREALKEIGGEG